MIQILERLGFELEEATAAEGPVWDVLIPYWRDGDVQREADLIEEVARIHGLDNLPATLPGAPARRRPAHARAAPPAPGRGRAARPRPERGDLLELHLPRHDGRAAPRRRAAAAPGQPAQRGPVDPAAAAPARPARRRPPQRRPRATGTPAVRVRARLPCVRAAVLERGPATARRDAGGRAPPPRRGGHGSAPAGAPARRDFFSVKAVLEAVLEIAGVAWWVEPGERPFLHPGRAATVLAGDERKLGWLGELHPLVARALGPPRPPPPSRSTSTCWPSWRRSVRVLRADLDASRP